MRCSGSRWRSRQPESIDRVSAQEVHHYRLAGQRASGGASCADRFHRARIPDARAADRSHHPGRERRAGALAAGAPAWIDMLAGVNDQLKRIYTTGFQWLDDAARQREAADFLSLPLRNRPRCSTQIAYRRNQTPALEPGIRFFTWVRRMTVDAFYTSEIGIRDIDYRGNTALAPIRSRSKRLRSR